MVKIIENHPKDSRVIYREDNIFQTLCGNMGTGGGNVPMVQEMDTSPKIVGSLCAHDDRGFNGQDIAQDKVVVNKKTVRRLTPIECERLQGLADNYTNVPFNNKPASDARRYKAIGNGMAQPCADYILECIIRGYEKEQKEQQEV